MSNKNKGEEYLIPEIRTELHVLEYLCLESQRVLKDSELNSESERKKVLNFIYQRQLEEIKSIRDKISDL